VELRSNRSNIHPTAKIADDVVIECDYLELGKHSYIGPGCRITCKSFIAGDYLWMPGNVDIGRGGCTGPNSNVKIGHSVGIFEGTVINPSENVTIGDCVGIGADCLIWTHGAYLDPLQGFPFGFESVSIGNNVWLPARSILLPGANIGNNVVIGTGSVITKDIPDGALAMGTPCKVIKENEYPKNLSVQEIDKILCSIVASWLDQLPHKGIRNEPRTVVSQGTITLDVDTTFDCIGKHCIGDRTDLSEDLRDFLRRYGIRIYNGQPFRSMRATYESRLKPTS
tara:strand:+ start:10827 stop:11672 length:846 start_codon:yes stop_codon:yes gene_type:complete